jgi:uncharacterized protein YjbI with pentapeptide repeats
LEPPTPPKGIQRRTSAGPRLRVPGPHTSAPDLPEFAKKADDLEAIKKAVDAAASVGGGLWLSYLFVLFYLAVAAGAVTHEDLFFERSVKLPFLNIELPLLAFFFLAPILFIIVHAYTLVHLVMLTDKTKRFHEELHRQISNDKKLPTMVRERNAAVRAGLRGQLPSNIFVQFLAGSRDIRESPFGWLLQGIAWLTLSVGPILLLLLMQIQFLPFHSLSITWTQRIVIGVDLVLLWWLWRKILSGRWPDDHRPRLHWVWPILRFAAAVAAILFSVAIATFPGEGQEAFLAKWDKPQLAISLRDWVFKSEVDPTTRRRWLPLSSTLVLPGLNVYEGLRIDDPDKTRWHDIFRARGRDLRGAIFDFAVLPRIDLTRAQLQGASLIQADMQSVSLDGAQLQGAKLGGARLQGASLESVNLQAASLDAAQLQGAKLDYADMTSAALDNAHLQGASLDGAQLQAADLSDAQLQGASLDFAQLQGARLTGAKLEATSLYGTQLQGALYKKRLFLRLNFPTRSSGAPIVLRQ